MGHNDRLFSIFSTKKFRPRFMSLKILERLEENSEDPDEVAQYEPPHQDLGCLQSQLFFFLAL